MTEYTPTERVFGHGAIVLTHYPSSQRVGVLQVGTNAVMDSWEFVEFARESGLLAAHDREVAAKALEDAAGEIRHHQHPESVRQALLARAAEYRNPEGNEG